MFNCVILPLLMINMSFMIDQPLCPNQQIMLYNDSYLDIRNTYFFTDNNVSISRADITSRIWIHNNTYVNYTFKELK